MKRSPLGLMHRTADHSSRRIVYVWDADYPWDVRAEKTCRTLVEAGHDVHIVARNRAWRCTEERLPEGMVHRMPPWRWAGSALDGALGFPAFFNPRWRGLLAQTVAATRPHLVIVRDLPLAPTALHIAGRHGMPVMLDMAEKYPEMMQVIFESGRQRPIDYLVRNPTMVAAVERYCLPRVDHLLVVVDEAADLASQLGVSPDRLTVVSNTPTRSRALDAALRTPRDDAPLELAYLGVMEIPRGLLDVIGAMRVLRGNNVAVRLKLIGGGRDLQALQQYAEALGLGPKDVQFTGHIASHEEAMRQLAAADVGVCPQPVSAASDWIIPNKIFDYMALGLPVLSADARPCVRVIHSARCGEVYRSGDAGDAARAVLRLLPAEVRIRMGEAGRRAILDRFNWERDSAALLNAVARTAREPTKVQAA